jgi:hypothetical protein
MTGRGPAEPFEKLVGREFGPDVYEIEPGLVRRFCEAIEDGNPRWERETPPTFPCALPPRRLLHEILDPDLPLPRLLNGSSELEYFLPIRVGDTIAVTGRLARVKPTAGPRLFLVTEITWTNRRGELAVRGRNTYIRY